MGRLLDIKTREELLQEDESPSRSIRNDENKYPRMPLGTIIEYDGIFQQVTSHNSCGYPGFSVSRAPIDWHGLSQVKILFLPVIDIDHSAWINAMRSMTWSQWKNWKASGYKTIGESTGEQPPWIKKSLEKETNAA